MNFLRCWAHWSLALLLCFCHGLQAAPSAKSKSTSNANTWAEVYQKSYCQPMPTAVSISGEHPSSKTRYNPPCVSLMRCGGCCNSENLECVPTETSNVTLPILQTMVTSNGRSSSMTDMVFLEHTKCDCVPKSSNSESGNSESGNSENKNSREPRR
ncbi:vascular endothelial growth factor-like protein [Seal parapoxvirus]|uniref:Vascular endothelial growth factor-like protein n=1 Tax=Seal parapoxvirus TaxID=187984 RepID=A0A1Z4CGF2_9POXV|nr:vascular endothelial growth factor-like protein [Seal parapoxvirus]ASF89979.1 vascular endothelial growth factor-like protein [Seal parapoxvirus]